MQKFWWHHVTSLDSSISINLFASTPLEFLRHGLVRELREWLHLVAVRCGCVTDCVCHHSKKCK